MKKINTRIFGIITGLLLPALIVVIFYLGDSNIDVDFFTFLAKVWEFRLFNTILKPSLLINLAVFMFFMQRKVMYFCQGLIIATAVYGVLLFIMYLTL